MRKTLIACALHLAMQANLPPGARLIRLSGEDGETRRVISNAVELAEGAQRSWVTVTRVGSFTDPRYGRFEITAAMLAEMVRNFDAGVVGTDIFLDVDHKPGDGAAAKLLQLKVDSGRLRAQVEWTDFGRTAVRDRGFRYLSAEFAEQWRDNEAGNLHGCVLLGAGLTIRPVIKRLDPVTLAASAESDFSGPVFVHPGLVRQLTESQELITMNRWQKYLAALATAGITLSQPQLDAIKATFEMGARQLAEDADDAEFIAQWVAAAKALAAAGTGATVNLSVTNPTAADPAAISAEVTRILAEQRQQQEQATADLATRRGQFTTLLAAATGLSEPTRTQLSEAANLINAQWSEDQVRQLAEQQIAIGERLEASRQLSALGYRPAGQVQHVTVDESNAIRSLSESIRVSLAATATGQTGSLRLLEETRLPPFVQRVLAQFDAENAPRLHREIQARQLAGGPVGIGDTTLPASYQREVIKEALSDLNILPLVDAAVEATTAATHTIPYEKRDTSGMTSEGATYEGQPISYVGVEQDVEFAYIEPMKLAINVSNEAAHFSANNPNIDWDAYARSVASVGRVAQETLHRRLANRWLRSSDVYAAAAFTGASAAAGTITGNYKLTQWPLVRPRQIKDLKGNAIGAVQHPLVVKVAGSPVAAYIPGGGQANGNYYVDNRNLYELGVVTIVNQAGVPQGSLTVTVDGYRVTNIVKVDLDVPGGTTYERHLNKLAQAVGGRKALLSQERHVAANFMLMAPTLADTISNAEQFEAGAKRDDANITSTGDLGVIKGLPSWQTNAPNLDLGENRILLSQRGLLRYRIAKAFALGAPFEVIDPSTGRPVGKKQAYGEEFSTVHVPEALGGCSTSITTYSATALTAL